MFLFDLSSHQVKAIPHDLTFVAPAADTQQRLD
jgi:hypothetical protein